MFKKLIALVEALMLVSLFCIGFASWSIIDPNGVTLGENGEIGGSIQTESVHNVSLDTIGFTSTSNQTSFKYNLTQIDSATTAEFSKTTLTIDVTFDKATLTALAYDGPYQLLFECNNKTNAVNIFEANGYLTPPTIATAHLSGFPNQKIESSITASASSLSAGFPIKSTSQLCLYNLIAKSSDATVTLVFTFEFTPKANTSSDYSQFVQAICWSTYELSFKISSF